MKGSSENPGVQLRRAAMDLLARREHSCRELYDKLGRRAQDPSLVRGVVAQLTEEGLQSDARFAESFLRSRMARGFGPHRIRLELAQRGVDRSLVEQVLSADDLDWRALMLEVAQRRFGTEPPGEAKERYAQLRWLQARGFDVSGWRGVGSEQDS